MHRIQGQDIFVHLTSKEWCVFLNICFNPSVEYSLFFENFDPIFIVFYDTLQYVFKNVNEINWKWGLYTAVLVSIHVCVIEKVLDRPKKKPMVWFRAS